MENPVLHAQQGIRSSPADCCVCVLHHLTLSSFVNEQHELMYSKKSGKAPKDKFDLKELQVVRTCTHVRKCSCILKFFTLALQVPDQNSIVHAGNYVIELRTRRSKLYISAPTEKDRSLWVSTLRSLQEEGQ